MNLNYWARREIVVPIILFWISNKIFDRVVEIEGMIGGRSFYLDKGNRIRFKLIGVRTSNLLTLLFWLWGILSKVYPGYHKGEISFDVHVMMRFLYSVKPLSELFLYSLFHCLFFCISTYWICLQPKMLSYCL